MPICPLDNTELIRFGEDIGSYFECPKHGARYIAWGITGLIPVPKAIVSNPFIVTGSSAVGNLVENSGGNLEYYLVGSSTPKPILSDIDAEIHIPLVSLASAQTI